MIKAQSIYNGLYINEKSNEFICFYNDTLQFRLKNYDAFGTFSICKGKYKVNNRGKYHIIQSNSTLEQTSLIKRFSRNDSLLVVKVIYNDSIPISAADVYVNDLKTKKSILVGITNKNGQVILNKEQDGNYVINRQIGNYVNKELFLEIVALGFSTKKIVVLERGYDYIIQSTIPETFPFTISRIDNILIKSLNAQEIEVEIIRCAKRRKKHYKTILRKGDSNLNCSNFLLDKDIKYFYGR